MLATADMFVWERLERIYSSCEQARRVKCLRADWRGVKRGAIFDFLDKWMLAIGRSDLSTG